ncbi:hypothetical protein AVDCRST_MAG81-4793 [uncultured Synechococcales cyanobacterium]|uniref:Uncharacterized protein n=1 Tax=uncultured Synechococcales cyanobacterium TaxID=1936017 RepID=A0A6J4VX63_9CYAN|nr:hypothetical protein AVDCRST_MAG81-4793 [uncultured Synechococcales cyanobacterium]
MAHEFLHFQALSELRMKELNEVLVQFSGIDKSYL